jgi:hypothetical protein
MATVPRRTIAQRPMLAKPARAGGFSLHIGSSGPPGHSNETAELKAITIATTQNTVRTVTPSGRGSARLTDSELGVGLERILRPPEHSR